MRPNWIKVAFLLALVWLIVFGATWVVRQSRATPERIAGFVNENTLEGKPVMERSKIIEKVAGQVNRLDYDERRQLDRERKLAGFWDAMDDSEKGRYLDLVLPSGFKQMMENFNKMEPGKRKRMVQKAVDDLRNRGGDQEARDVNDPQFKKIIEQGLKSFYSDASIDAKMDALPFLEALEQTVKWSRQ